MEENIGYIKHVSSLEENQHLTYGMRTSGTVVILVIQRKRNPGCDGETVSTEGCDIITTYNYEPDHLCSLPQYILGSGTVSLVPVYVGLQTDLYQFKYRIDVMHDASWLDAEEFCLNHGAHLISLQYERENEIIQTSLYTVFEFTYLFGYFPLGLRSTDTVSYLLFTVVYSTLSHYDT